MTRARAIGPAAAGALIFLAAGVRADVRAIELARLAVLGIALGSVAAIDLADHKIPNRIVMPASLACSALLAAESLHVHRLLTGFGVVALMLGVSIVWPASLGMGDVKLAFLIVLGLAGLAAQALLLGLVIAAAFGALLIVRQGRLAGRQMLPLAPFLGSGAALTVFL